MHCGVVLVGGKVVLESWGVTFRLWWVVVGELWWKTLLGGGLDIVGSNAGVNWELVGADRQIDR